MKVFLYSGMQKMIEKSGVGRAIYHQKKAADHRRPDPDNSGGDCLYRAVQKGAARADGLRPKPAGG